MTSRSGSIILPVPSSTTWTRAPRSSSVIAYIVAVFLADNFFGLAAVTLFLVLAVIFSRVPPGRVLRSAKMILFLVVFTAVLNLFFSSGESAYEPLWKWGIVSVTWECIVNAVFLAVRLFLLVLGTAILTLTTTPVALTDGIESPPEAARLSSKSPCTSWRSP